MKIFSRWFLGSCIILALGTILVDFFELFSLAEANTLIPFNPESYPGVNSSLINNRTGAEGTVEVVKSAINTLKRLLGPVLVFVMGGFAIQLLITGGNEDKFTSAANHFFYVLVGIAFVALADFLSQTFLLYQTSDSSFLSDNQKVAQAAQAVKNQIALVIKFLRYILGGVALIYVVKSGAVILFNAEDESVEKQKDIFIYGFTGLILIMGSEALINAVFDVKTLDNITSPILGAEFTRPEVNVVGGISLLTNVTNLLLALMSGLFMFTLVIGGSMYTFSAGNEERGQKGTKVIIGSLVGLAIAFSSYTIVAEFSSGGRDLKVAPNQNFRISVPSTPTSP
jgi:hypothetical protein